MRAAMIGMLSGLGGNKKNRIIHRDRSGKVRRVPFSELGAAVDESARRLKALKTARRKDCVGILGAPSYEWLMLDLACMKAGLKSAAIPEAAKPEFWSLAARETCVSLLLVDVSLRDSVPAGWDVIFFGDKGLEWSDREDAALDSVDLDPEDLPEEFTFTFSSGTSGTMKAIPIPLKREEGKQDGAGALGTLKRLYKVYAKWGTLWFRKGNRLILFLPFSHFVQRGMAYLALQRKIDLVISSPQFFLRDLVKEKPNILISAPVIYETLAAAVREKLQGLRGWRSALYRVFRGLGMNGWPDGNPLKRITRRMLLREALGLLGGRPDYFVSGMAPISMGALRTFHDAGIRIYQAYGLSETDNIALSTPGCYRLGSVGKPILPLKISPDSEILVKSSADRNRAGFLVEDEEGYLQTGDLGYLDDEGFLFLIGRKDDLLVLRNGTKVVPQPVEDRIREEIAGSIPVVLTLDGQSLSLVLGCRNRANAITPSQARTKLASLNRQAPSHERITGFHIPPHPFAVENGLITGTGKVRRREVEAQFRTAVYEWM